MKQQQREVAVAGYLRVHEQRLAQRIKHKGQQHEGSQRKDGQVEHATG